MTNGLRITEIFHSIQGESSWVGCPCVFVRLSGCPLRCTYCDTSYAFTGGDRMTVDAILDRIAAYPTRLLQVTGGEPLAQVAVFDLMTRAADGGWTVLLETSGACDIRTCDPRVHRIVDLKTPGSGECARNRLDDLTALTKLDEVKFVVTDRTDYEWCRDILREHDIAERCRSVLFSPVFEQVGDQNIEGCRGLPAHELAAWILEDGLHVRLQLQQHKMIWDPQARGV